MSWPYLGWLGVRGWRFIPFLWLPFKSIGNLVFTSACLVCFGTVWGRTYIDCIGLFLFVWRNVITFPTIKACSVQITDRQAIANLSIRANVHSYWPTVTGVTLVCLHCNHRDVAHHKHTSNHKLIMESTDCFFMMFKINQSFKQNIIAEEIKLPELMQPAQYCTVND